MIPILNRQCFNRRRWPYLSLLLSVVSIGHAEILATGHTSPASITSGGSATADTYIGLWTDGSLEINNGSVLLSDDGAVGYGGPAGGKSIAFGTATVTGAGSTWTLSNQLIIGDSGNGTLTINAGASVTCSTCKIGIRSGSAGKVELSGPTSSLNGTLDIRWGSVLVEDGASCNGSYLVGSYESGGRMDVRGSGTHLTPTNVSVGSASGDSGNLQIQDGARITTNGQITNWNGYISIDVTGSGILKSTSTNSFYNFRNNGTVSMYANASLAPGIYTPIEAGIFDGSGVYLAYGGTWDHANHTFTVAQPVEVGEGGVVNQDVSGSRLSLENNSVIASFQNSAGTISFDAEALADEEINGETLLSGYAITPAPDPSISISKVGSDLVGEHAGGIIQESSGLTGWTSMYPQPSSPFSVVPETPGPKFFRVRAE